ncbi:hypothetical protein ACFFKU_06855 [Kineococcus gynurae]|uniref:Uncharacterized protein n=1 Tax=Kineococcus gynurae TaxID=452979 RepID=A0ABV5LWX9_9ACTN
MAITTAPKAQRFFNAGITEILFLPIVAASALSSKAAGYLKPTAAELNNAVRLSDDIADIAGWSVSSGFIDTPDLGSRFTSRITGRTTSDDSSLTFYADPDGLDARRVLPRTTKGFIVVADGGYGTAGDLADVFAVEVGSVGKVRSVSDTAMQLTIGFAITAQPAEDVALPVPA